MTTRFFESLDDNKLLKPYKDSCSECKEHNTTKKKFCFHLNPLEEGHWLEDYYRKKKIKIISLEDLYEHYIAYTSQQVEHFEKKYGFKNLKRDDYLSWLIKRGICPWGVISKNSVYWYELISLCCGEMGVNMPYGPTETPDLFFQALGIVNKEKSELRKEKEKLGNKKNSDINQAGRNS